MRSQGLKNASSFFMLVQCIASFICLVSSFRGGSLLRPANNRHAQALTRQIRFGSKFTAAGAGASFTTASAAAATTALRATILSEEGVETGPVINTQKRAKIQSFINKMGGKRVLQRILIANNGMAATKAILSMRHWAYRTFGDEKTIEFVALATRDDLNANAEFIRLADTFVEVPSGSNKNNYANVDLIVDIAVAQKVDAVWPGWGHASENPKLPATLKAKGIQFIGPTAPVMAALGDKVSANILAQTAKVPSIPWSGQGIECALNSDGVIPQEVFQQACVTTAEEATAAAELIGFPVMIKASEGGGGKGIRMVHNKNDLKNSFIQVQNEVPGSPIFMMQLCTGARHLEVQIVGDEYGNAVALNGRDCSTQRRFQKIFEEGPPIVAPREVFREMERAAQRLTQSIGYIGAGTVEYLYSPAENKFYFLELNPRLQVEHPVTEGLTGINLPSLQLQVAMGIPLSHVPDVLRFFGRDPTPSVFEDIDFMTEEYPYPQKHVIAARITAENPDEGFKPTSGKIERVKFQSTDNVWGYFSVGANGGIHEFADSQFGHLFASGSTREEARKSLVLALKEIDVRGDIRTTVEYLIKLLEMEAFKQNTIDTSWLDGIIKEKTVAVEVDPEVVALSAAVFKAHSSVHALTSDFVSSLSKGQTSLMSIPALLKFPVEITYEDVKYSFSSTTLGPNYYRLSINGQSVDVRVREQPDKSLLCSIGGEVYQLFGQEEPLGLRMRINGATVMIPTVYNPSELRSDVTGKIVRFLQQDREFVEKDQPYVEVEAMKMIMAIKATESGEIRHSLSPGSIIAAGDLIASLTLKDPSKVKQISTFTDRLTFIPTATGMTLDEAAEQISLAVDGFAHDVEAASKAYFSAASLSLEDAQSFLAQQLGKFITTGAPFIGKEEEEVVGELAKAKKDDLLSIVPTLIAQKQLKTRINAVTTLLRELEVLPSRFSDFKLTTDRLSSELQDALRSIAERLEGAAYGPLKLKAQQMIESSLMPPFAQRVESLKKQLLAPGVDLSYLAKQPNLAVSVDLLGWLMRSEEESMEVRKAAVEVYIRRVYRANCIKELLIRDSPTGLSVYWSFTLREMSGSGVRKGYMAILPDTADIDTRVSGVIRDAQEFLGSAAAATAVVTAPLNVLHIAFSKSGEVSPSAPADSTAAALQATLLPRMSELKGINARMVNFMLVGGEGSSKPVSYFNYYAETAFQEDPLSRDMRPTVPQLLELNRLTKNHDLLQLPSVGRNSFTFLGTEKTAGSATAAARKGFAQQVLFLRAISLSADSAEPAGAERIVLMALEELERAMLDSRVSNTASSRLFVNVLADIPMDLRRAEKQFRSIMDGLVAKYATRLLNLRVDEIEVKLRVTGESDGDFVPIRLIASSSTGGWLTREAYIEYLDPITGQTQQYRSLSSLTGAVTSSDATTAATGAGAASIVLDPYPTSTVLQKKRAIARRVGSTYATDFLGLIEVALINSWQRYFEQIGAVGSSSPANLFTFDELVLDSSSSGGEKKLVKQRRFPGENKIGMLAWHTTLKTPHYPLGRDVVFIANDVTVQSGSFGVLEDEFFFKASEYARTRGLPRIFISCNSGARIGLVEELKPKFKVAWKVVDNPSQGFDYLYLSEEDFQQLPAGTVAASEIIDGGERRYKLDAIIGQIHGIGVENLRGSGLIAGETSRAYDETFTLSYVTGRSVGIGAYLNRLGQRVIQMQQGPMILTGFSALNKLLGKEVYTSQDQLGGPQIMYPNGVTHVVVPDDREGMQAVVDWLNFTPRDFTATAPVLPNAALHDPPSRAVEFMPTKTPYDPRHMLAGQPQPDGSFLSGFCDKGSFKEYLGGWGKSVVVGRGRVGGINVGVIAVETRLVEQRIPADPGNPESRESIQPQAGQVWYPDSAFKTAQAIQDFNRGENLPLIIFANWRGFSGGTRDMYGEILKYGAMIVDSLRTYKHPVFVYIPPAGELRGGAWVVIDPTINERKMEMFADQNSRGGILEPPGICEVKYRTQEQLATMHRLDPQLQELDEMRVQMGALSSGGPEEQQRVAAEIEAREKALLPLYTQIAHEFADLHDRAGRMKAKGCIDEILEWRSSRHFFYWRILKRQKIDAVVDAVLNYANSNNSKEEIMSYTDAIQRVMSVIPADVRGDGDQAIVEWLNDNEAAMQQLLNDVAVEFSTATVHALLESLPENVRQQVVDKIHGKK